MGNELDRSGYQGGVSPSQPPLVVRALQENDFRGWKPLWDGYNAFYGRQAQTVLPSEITQIAKKKVSRSARTCFCACRRGRWRTGGSKPLPFPSQHDPA